MITFWITAAGMLGLALAVLLPTLLGRYRQTDQISFDELNLSIFKERMAELEQDQAAGRLTEEELEQSRHELERELIYDLEKPKEELPAIAATISGKMVAIAVGVAVPVLTLVLYSVWGNMDALGYQPQPARQSASTQHATGGGSGEGQQSLESMIKNMAAKMESQPENTQGWLMLGRSYTILKQFDKAKESLSRAMKLAPDNAEVLSSYAEVLGQLSGGATPEIEGLLAKALKQDPNNQRALWLSGVIAQQRSDFRTAIAHWEKLEKIVPPEEAGPLGKYLERARKQLQSIEGALSGNATAMTQQQAGAVQAAIVVEVSLAPELTQSTSPSDTVFIFARAASGPRMPLAIVRKTVADLPASITLDDNMAMTPDLKISNFPNVVIEARISKTGNAMPQPGDLTGLSGDIPTGGDNATIQVIIDGRI